MAHHYYYTFFRHCDNVHMLSDPELWQEYDKYTKVEKNDII
jgi:hypothetical protein